jgi:hypothetical protein
MSGKEKCGEISRGRNRLLRLLRERKEKKEKD